MSVAGVFSGNQLVDELRRALGQRGSRDDLVEARFMRRAETGGVCVVRVAEDRDVRPGVRNLVRVDPREVANDHVGRVHAVGRDQLVGRSQERVQLSSKEEIDPRQQDRRHGRERTTLRGQKTGALLAFSRMAVTACFARKVALWFEREGAEQVADPVRLRQMNMAIALAASRWNEFAGDDDPVGRMNAWLDEVERRAVVRGADARAEAIRLARSWFTDCLGDPSAQPEAK